MPVHLPKMEKNEKGSFKNLLQNELQGQLAKLTMPKYFLIFFHLLTFSRASDVKHEIHKFYNPCITTEDDDFLVIVDSNKVFGGKKVTANFLGNVR